MQPETVEPSVMVTWALPATETPPPACGAPRPSGRVEAGGRRRCGAVRGAAATARGGGGAAAAGDAGRPAARRRQAARTA